MLGYRRNLLANRKMKALLFVGLCAQLAMTNGEDCCRYDCKKGGKVCPITMRKIGNVNMNGNKFFSRILQVADGLEYLKRENMTKVPSNQSWRIIIATAEKAMNTSIDDVTTYFRNLTQSVINEVQVVLNATPSAICGQVNCLSAVTESSESVGTTDMDSIYPPDCENVSREDAKITTDDGGVFDVFPDMMKFEVYCDLDGGGWTVFQRRMDGSVNFNRNWDDYVNGFGNKTGEFWLGLEAIHQMTANGDAELALELIDRDGNTAYANYGTFSVAGISTNYTLVIDQYSPEGTAGDSLSYSRFPFSSPDRDNDDWDEGNCAAIRRGAWWFGDCAYSNLNGEYNATGLVIHGGYDGLEWRDWKGSEPVKGSEMKFRKKLV